MKKSLQSTLGMGLSLSLLLVFFLLWLVVSDAVKVVAEGYIGSRLENDAESLLAAMFLSKAGDWQVDHKKLNANYRRPFSGRYYKIGVGPQELLSRSLWDIDLPDITSNSDRATITRIPGPQAQTLLAYIRTYSKQGQVLTILVAEDFTPIAQDIRVLLIKLAFAASAILVLVTLLQIALLRWSLRPLKKASNDLHLLERGEIKKLNIDVPAEITPLVLEINRLFDAMTSRLRRSRNAIGDLSHALKTPLTIMQQLLADHGKLQQPQTAKICELQISSIHNIIHRNLKKARLAGDGPGGANFHIAKDLADLIETINMMYPNISVEWVAHDEDIDVLPYDRDDMLELLGNILDNAAKWAKCRVRVTSQMEKPTQVSFLVDDDGPGISANQKNALLQRGTRLDENIEGQGIGLAICTEIVSQYGGELLFLESDDGSGLRVKITLAW
ncbi:MAG: ATP-binding protein [Thiohalomonadales bacterium]